MPEYPDKLWGYSGILMLAINHPLEYNYRVSLEKGVIAPFRKGQIQENERRACRNEGSIICEADLREVQGYQEKRQNYDHLREPEAQAETGLITESLQ